MIIYPAIDLRGGKVVRLREGDPKKQTIYSSNPVDTALNWIDQGAEWIHMVNLDGAFRYCQSESSHSGIGGKTGRQASIRWWCA